MTQFDKAFEIVCSLVNDFKANEQYYLSLSYQEKEVRSDFIDKFFIALGWDVLHNEQKNPYEQEVKVEKGVNVSGAQKRADYSFSLAPDFRNPKFFVEAKKPAHDLNNADYYFQTIRYGWHKATPLAVLTDFEQFHILDCRFIPDINTILNRKIKQYHYTEYTDVDKFAEIYWLFSREAVADNSIEEYAKGLPKLKGKAAKKALLPLEAHLTIDEAFLIEIDGIREKLAKAFKKNDDSLNSEELTEATQRTIDRLVFIRFLEDKLIEQKHYVHEFGTKGTAWHDFITLCRKLDAKYNGIVFKKTFIDTDTFIGPAEREFYCICQDLCHLNSRFLFNEIPIHILGSIYERFLGKVVNATAQRVKIEVKPEVRKAGGVYYTPKYIVDYIVQNTVGKLIEGKTSEQIAQMRFADIACGSGSFLISVFDCLLDYHNKYYQKYKAKAKDDGCIEKDGIMVLSIKQKQKILQNNIYGVDIDNQAVEVTQLSLYLKLLEDETTATANEMQVLFHEKILPDMSKNIICGNSLIGTDILTDNLFVGNEERKLNPMDFESAFPEVFKSKTQKGYIFIPDIGIDEVQDIDSNQVNDPMIPHKEIIKGGFDAVVGNPPYVRVDTLEDEIKDYIFKTFQSAKGKYDLYYLFVERAFSLIKKNGNLGYIVPNRFTTSDSGFNLRKLLTENANSIFINSVSKIKVFKNAATYPNIIIINGKEKGVKELVIKESKSQEELYLTNNLVKLKSNEISKLPNLIFPLNSCKTIINLYFKLIDICSLSEAIFIIQEGLRIPKDIEKTEGDYHIIKQYQFSRYSPVIKGSYADESSLFKIVNPKSERFINCLKPKLIFAEDALKIEAIFDLSNSICQGGVYFATLIKETKLDFKYLLALYNSKLLTKLYEGLFAGMHMGGGYLRFRTSFLNKLPINEINFQNKTEKAQHDKMVNLVEQMLQAKKQQQSAKIDKDKTYIEHKCINIDMQIDKLVYELYGLTEEEIEIVENKTNGTN